MSKYGLVASTLSTSMLPRLTRFVVATWGDTINGAPRVENAKQATTPTRQPKASFITSLSPLDPKADKPHTAFKIKTPCPSSLRRRWSGWLQEPGLDGAVTLGHPPFVPSL